MNPERVRSFMSRRVHVISMPCKLQTSNNWSLEEAGHHGIFVNFGACKLPLTIFFLHPDKKIKHVRQNCSLRCNKTCISNRLKRSTFATEITNEFEYKMIALKFLSLPAWLLNSLIKNTCSKIFPPNLDQIQNPLIIATYPVLRLCGRNVKSGHPFVYSWTSSAIIPCEYIKLVMPSWKLCYLLNVMYAWCMHLCQQLPQKKLQQIINPLMQMYSVCIHFITRMFLQKHQRKTILSASLSKKTKWNRKGHPCEERMPSAQTSQTSQEQADEFKKNIWLSLHLNCRGIECNPDANMKKIKRNSANEKQRNDRNDHLFHHPNHH